MKTIAIMSEKGGIGKTITATSIAYILGEELDNKILFCDSDPQGNASQIFGLDETESTGLSELLERHYTVGGEYTTKELIQSTLYQNIDIIPANDYLDYTNIQLSLDKSKEQIQRFKTALAEVESEYDYCICDCGLRLNLPVLNIIYAADLVIAPVKIGGFELKAIQSLKEKLKDFEQLREQIKVKGLITMLQNNKTSLQVADWLLNESEHEMFRIPIKRSIIVEKSTITLKPLPNFSKRCITTQNYREIVNEIMNDMER